jgi:hypothetical protein
MLLQVFAFTVAPTGKLQNLPSGAPGIPDVTVCGTVVESHTHNTVSPGLIDTVDGEKLKVLFGPTCTVTVLPAAGGFDAGVTVALSSLSLHPANAHSPTKANRLSALMKHLPAGKELQAIRHAETRLDGGAGSASRKPRSLGKEFRSTPHARAAMRISDGEISEWPAATGFASPT